jgi:Lhr-like helicase
LRRTLHESDRRGAGLRTLYISPLKALAVDVQRNLIMPIAEMSLEIKRRDPHWRHPVKANASSGSA